MGMMSFTSKVKKGKRHWSRAGKVIGWVLGLLAILSFILINAVPQIAEAVGEFVGNGEGAKQMMLFLQYLAPCVLVAISASFILAGKSRILQRCRQEGKETAGKLSIAAFTFFIFTLLAIGLFISGFGSETMRITVLAGCAGVTGILMFSCIGLMCKSSQHQILDATDAEEYQSLFVATKETVRPS